MPEEQFKALDERLERIENGLVLVSEGVSGLHTAVADARHDIGGLGDKLVRIQVRRGAGATRIFPRFFLWKRAIHLRSLSRVG